MKANITTRAKRTYHGVSVDYLSTSSVEFSNPARKEDENYDGDVLIWEEIQSFEPLPEGWHMHYKVERWSLEFADADLPSRKMGFLWDLGYHETIETFVDGTMPGTYIAEHEEHGTVTIVIGKT